MSISTTAISSSQARSTQFYATVFIVIFYATAFIVILYATVFICDATKFFAWYVIRPTAGGGNLRTIQSDCC